MLHGRAGALHAVIDRRAGSGHAACNLELALGSDNATRWAGADSLPRLVPVSWQLSSPSRARQRVPVRGPRLAFHAHLPRRLRTPNTDLLCPLSRAQGYLVSLARPAREATGPELTRQLMARSHFGTTTSRTLSEDASSSVSRPSVVTLALGCGWGWIMRCLWKRGELSAWALNPAGRGQTSQARGARIQRADHLTRPLQNSLSDTESRWSGTRTEDGSRSRTATSRSSTSASRARSSSTRRSR